MGPSSATTWGSGSSLSGDLGEPPASVGWTAEPGAAFSVIQTKLTTTTASAGGNFGWFNSASGADNSDGSGRGAVTLMWPAVSGAAGYHVYLNDGSGTYRQVGATEGGKSILWSSNGSAFYPSDTEIAGLGKPFTGNPYYRAATPSDGFGSGANSTPTTLQATVTPSPAVSPSPPGIGGIAPDGTSGDYVYDLRR